MRRRMSLAVLASALVVFSGACARSTEAGAIASVSDARGLSEQNVQQAVEEAKEGTEAVARIGSLVKAGEVLIGYKLLDVTGDRLPDAVLIVRRGQSSGMDGRADIACDFRVFRGEGGSLVPMGSNGNVVDCKSNQFARVIAAAPTDLNEYIEMKPLEVSYDNVKDAGHAKYSFRYSREKDGWYASEVTISYPEASADGEGMVVVNGQASSPEDFPETPLSTFDPEALVEVLKGKRTVVQ